MIIKELEVQTHTDPLRRAGYEAERQMAHYLKRAFGEKPEIKLLHNLRIERQGEVAQIDHLVLYRHGIIVIESKSVTGQISVNERGEWARHWKGSARGMPSPVLQGQRQGELLHRLLDDHDEQLLGKLLLGKLQKRFGTMHIDVLVAVSDSGIIQGGKHVPAEVLKADQIPDRVTELTQHYRKANGVLSLNFKDAGYEATPAELSGIAAFLNARHQPLGRTEAVPMTSQKSAPAPRPSAPRGLAGVVSPPHSLPVAVPALPEPAQTPNCRQCHSDKLSIQYGKYGYYFKCAACDANTPAKPVCPTCSQSARLSKSGAQFTATCAGGHQWRYWTNG
ncbi:nuclease-related domain-containing protein [Deinococcus sp. SM5_A1]|uniref:nuclease-related domain-containing protein n=1 Tax=Deinococcus sp. SM5_A1 TaxID=3379094 RepID=UPI00385E636F